MDLLKANYSSNVPEISPSMFCPVSSQLCLVCRLKQYKQSGVEKVCGALCHIVMWKQVCKLLYNLLSFSVTWLHSVGLAIISLVHSYWSVEAWL